LSFGHSVATSLSRNYQTLVKYCILCICRANVLPLPLCFQTRKIPHPEFQLLGSPRIGFYRCVPHRKYNIFFALAILRPVWYMADSMVIGIEVVNERDPGAGNEIG
jgi:hypothetical protein